MKKLIIVTLAILLSSFSAAAQKSNAELSSQIKNNKIKLTYDAGSGSSKLMAIAENFPDSEAKAAKVMAMNFAAGFFYAGDKLERTPNEIQLTFWVKSKKPQFAEKHSLTIYSGGEILEIGEARYVARVRDNMEYLNFNIDRDVLMRACKYSDVQFKLGDANFAFTKDQLRMLADLLILSDPINN